jgi:hypothetical protein
MELVSYEIKKMRKILKIFFLLLLINLFLPKIASAVENDNICAIYFTGIGCPHCAQADPVVLEELPKKYPNLVIIEYEIYQQSENAPFLDSYCQAYNLPYCRPGGPSPCCGIPLVIFAKDKIIVGDTPILKNIETILEQEKDNPCPLIDGGPLAFANLDLSSLPGNPKIWMKESEGVSVHEFQKSESRNELTLTKVLSLAAVDAVNPCALAVLTLMLIAVCTYDPRKRKNLLLAGLAFTISVFIMYLFYGLIIVRFFQLISFLTNIKLWLYKILGLVAIILGVLNIKDFLSYKPGSLGTEMPISLRPKVKKIIASITSPKGAFGVGAFVTVFLLPCTIGPYVICGGILCPLSLLETLPWLLLYNSIFVLPMLAITAACYVGFTTVENVSGWKEKNIRYLHLIAGLIIFGLGTAMVLGLV